MLLSQTKNVAIEHYKSIQLIRIPGRRIFDPLQRQTYLLLSTVVKAAWCGGKADQEKPKTENNPRRFPRIHVVDEPTSAPELHEK